MSKNELFHEDAIFDLKNFSATRATQFEIVMRALDESIQRIRISVLLPRIFIHYNELSLLLRGTEFEPGLKMLNEFMLRRDKLIQKDITPLMDHKLVELIDYFQENHKIYDILPAWWNLKLTPDECKLLKAFSMLKHIAAQHLKRTSLSEIASERKLHLLHKQNEKLKVEINDLKDNLKKQKLNLRWKMAAKHAYLQKNELDLAAKKFQNHARIQKEIDDCMRLVRNSHRDTLQKQKELEEELAETKNSYESLKKINAKSEKEARNEKNKILLQLQAMLKKYDQSLGEKRCEHLALKEEYDKVIQKIDDFMEIYKAEEAIYNEIVVKREEEEHLRQQQRVILFMMNRAARIIQRYWRAWKRWQRKKNKKFKKSKKDKKKT